MIRPLTVLLALAVVAVIATCDAPLTTLTTCGDVTGDGDAYADALEATC